MSHLSNSFAPASLIHLLLFLAFLHDLSEMQRKIFVFFMRSRRKSFASSRFHAIWHIKNNNDRQIYARWNFYFRGRRRRRFWNLISSSGRLGTCVEGNLFSEIGSPTHAVCAKLKSHNNVIAIILFTRSRSHKRCLDFAYFCVLKYWVNDSKATQVIFFWQRDVLSCIVLNFTSSLLSISCPNWKHYDCFPNDRLTQSFGDNPHALKTKKNAVPIDLL